MNKPFSQACENNKTAILPLLAQSLKSAKTLLEIGSGTGQHAVYFAPNMPWLTWQTSDRAINHQGINCWLKEQPTNNLLAPLTLDLHHDWPIKSVDAIYTANTLHIISWPLVQTFFAGVAQHLALAGRLCIYGRLVYRDEIKPAYFQYKTQCLGNNIIQNVSYYTTAYSPNSDRINCHHQRKTKRKRRLHHGS